jgi:hypothetical protein
VPGNFGVVTLVLVLAAACGPDARRAPPTATTSATSTQAAGFPVATFAAISEDPVTEQLAAKFQEALSLHDVADGGGMSATVSTVEGTWSGTTGKADDVRDVQVDDQFAIASITKSVVAAQVMLMVEAGELGLDDLVADHLPRDLQFDTNEATIRHLLSPVPSLSRGWSGWFTSLMRGRPSPWPCLRASRMPFSSAGAATSPRSRPQPRTTPRERSHRTRLRWRGGGGHSAPAIVVLTNYEVDDGHFAFSHGLARPLVDAPSLTLTANDERVHTTTVRGPR